MRSYKAARRAANRAEGQVDPVDFEVSWFEKVTGPDGTPVELEQTEVFHAYGEPSMATLTDAGYFAELNTDTPEAMAIIRRIFMEAIGDEDEFKRFWKISRHLGDTLIDIMGGLIEDTLGRPTKRPSDSPPSSPNDGEPSRVVSLPGGFSTQATPVESSDSQRASS
jgi:hypothetical protein